jgi:nucleotide-binding universal stress UspA family protein
MFKKMVVPLDGSRCAERACDIALNLAKAESAELAFRSIADPATVAVRHGANRNLGVTRSSSKLRICNPYCLG